MTLSGFLIFFLTHVAVATATLILPAFVTGYVVWRWLGSPRP